MLSVAPYALNMLSIQSISKVDMFLILSYFVWNYKSDCNVFMKSETASHVKFQLALESGILYTLTS